MKYTMIKHPGGSFSPIDDMEAEALSNLPNASYEVEIKRSRNPAFHGKMFAFLGFCFAHWKSDREFMDEKGQFDVFRKNLTVLAGFYNEYYTIGDTVRIEAKSLSYSNMDQAEFEQCYNALISVAIRKIFIGCGPEIENRLLSFF